MDTTFQELGGTNNFLLKSHRNVNLINEFEGKEKQHTEILTRTYENRREKITDS